MCILSVVVDICRVNNFYNPTTTNNVSVDRSRTTNVEEVQYMGMNDLNVNNNGGDPADSSDD